jgi:hypothetical protein
VLADAKATTAREGRVIACRQPGLKFIAVARMGPARSPARASRSSGGESLAHRRGSDLCSHSSGTAVSANSSGPQGTRCEPLMNPSER